MPFKSKLLRPPMNELSHTQIRKISFTIACNELMTKPWSALSVGEVGPWPYQTLKW